MRLVDQAGVEVLEHDECVRLLSTCAVGRLGVVDAGQPVILPVNFLVTDDSIVFRTGAGTKLRHAQGSPACFEVDEIDPATQSGWSVLAVGRLEEVTDYDEAEVRRLRTLPLSPWAEGERSHWLRLVTTRVTGRQVGPATAR